MKKCRANRTREPSLPPSPCIFLRSFRPSESTLYRNPASIHNRKRGTLDGSKTNAKPGIFNNPVAPVAAGAPGSSWAVDSGPGYAGTSPSFQWKQSLGTANQPRVMSHLPDSQQHSDSPANRFARLTGLLRENHFPDRSIWLLLSFLYATLFPGASSRLICRSATLHKLDRYRRRKRDDSVSR